MTPFAITHLIISGVIIALFVTGNPDRDKSFVFAWGLLLGSGALAIAMAYS